MAAANNTVLDSFLTPEAMLTPGAAGALTMMITNALGVSFSSPRALTALILSFAFGLLVLVADKPFWVKIVFYLLNSLVIFCVANGANGIGAAQQRASLAIINPAAAQTESSPEATRPAIEAKPVVSEELARKYQQLSEEYDGLSKKIEAASTSSISKDELVSLVNKRDDVEKQRTSILNGAVKAQTGISIKDIEQKGIQGGTNSFFNKSFFAPWRF
jgi:hypothetical protein